MTVRNDEIAATFSNVFLRLTRLLNRRMASEGASLARTRVLMLLKRKGTVKAADIADIFSLAPRTVTDTLDGMERQGLIRREADLKDRRVKRILLTDAGLDALSATEPMRLDVINRAFGALDDEERDQFARMLGKMEQAVQDMEEADQISC